MLAGMKIRAWIDHSHELSTRRKDLYVLKVDVLQTPGGSKDYTSTGNGQAYTFKSITFLLNICGVAPAVTQEVGWVISLTNVPQLRLLSAVVEEGADRSSDGPDPLNWRCARASNVQNITELWFQDAARPEKATMQSYFDSCSYNKVCKHPGRWLAPRARQPHALCASSPSDSSPHCGNAVPPPRAIAHSRPATHHPSFSPSHNTFSTAAATPARE
jgi:hypothetical protein